MAIHNSLSELIGNTPLIKLNHVTDGVKATIAVKVEYFNPGGSSKDRIAARIIDAAEREGKLKPGGVIVEPTSGNTGVGLAMVAQQRGYRTVFVVPDKVNETKRAVLRAYGAEVVVTPTDVEPDAWYASDVARAAELGIMEGVGGGLFEPERAVTRAELAAVVVRLAEKLGK